MNYYACDANQKVPSPHLSQQLLQLTQVLQIHAPKPAAQSPPLRSIAGKGFLGEKHFRARRQQELHPSVLPARARHSEGERERPPRALRLICWLCPRLACRPLSPGQSHVAKLCPAQGSIGAFQRCPFDKLCYFQTPALSNHTDTSLMLSPFSSS